MVDDTQNDSTPKTLVTFTATTDDVDTKTTIWYEEGLKDGVFKTRLMLSDHIAVNGTKSDTIIKLDAIGSKVQFVVEDVIPPYYAVTATHVAKDADGTTLKYDSNTHTYELNYSQTQKYRLVNSNKTTSHHSAADILAAYSDDENLHLKHLSTFLAINIAKSSVEENIKKVYIRQGDGSNIAGQWFVKYDDNEPYLEPGELKNPIEYEGVTSDYSETGIPQDKVLLVGLPSYDYADGLIITIEDMNNRFASFKISEAKYADQGGKILPFKPEFNPETRRTINSAADWNAFADHINKTNGDAYQWIGGGTIVLEDDITAASLTPITANFKYVFDGNGKTITLTKATKPLFSNVSGEIKNLTLDGNLDLGSASGAPLVNTLKAGGKVTNCTNKMSVTANRSGHTYVAGLVSVMEGGVIADCTNAGKIDITVNVDKGFYNVAVAGVVADVRVTDATRSLLLENCKNTADLTLYPELSFRSLASTADKGMQVCGFGGVAGWVRNAATYTFKNCDNEGIVTLSASKITHANGNSPRTISVGGIVGLAAPCTAGLMVDPVAENFPSLKVKLEDCDNSALIYNCGVNYSSRGETNNKVFTGAIAGSLMGTLETYADVINCNNTGDIITHDYTSADTGLTASGRPNFCVVAGGLIGYGGYLNIDGCAVKCKIGNGKRQMAAWGGVIGFTMRPFVFKNSVVDVSGYFASYSGYDENYAAVAVVPVKDGDNVGKIVPNVADSQISNNTIKCQLRTFVVGSKTADATKTADLSSSIWESVFETEDKIRETLVAGEGFTANDGITIGDDNVYIPAN